MFVVSPFFRELISYLHSSSSHFGIGADAILGGYTIHTMGRKRYWQKPCPLKPSGCAAAQHGTQHIDPPMELLRPIFYRIRHGQLSSNGEWYQRHSVVSDEMSLPPEQSLYLKY